MNEFIQKIRTLDLQKILGFSDFLQQKLNELNEQEVDWNDETAKENFLKQLNNVEKSLEAVQNELALRSDEIEFPVFSKENFEYAVSCLRSMRNDLTTNQEKLKAIITEYEGRLSTAGENATPKNDSKFAVLYGFVTDTFHSQDANNITKHQVKFCVRGQEEPSVLTVVANHEKRTLKIENGSIEQVAYLQEILSKKSQLCSFICAMEAKFAVRGTMKDRISSVFGDEFMNRLMEANQL